MRLSRTGRRQSASTREWASCPISSKCRFVSAPHDAELFLADATPRQTAEKKQKLPCESTVSPTADVKLLQHRNTVRRLFGTMPKKKRVQPESTRSQITFAQWVWPSFFLLAINHCRKINLLEASAPTALLTAHLGYGERGRVLGRYRPYLVCNVELSQYWDGISCYAFLAFFSFHS